MDGAEQSVIYYNIFIQYIYIYVKNFTVHVCGYRTVSFNIVQYSDDMNCVNLMLKGKIKPNKNRTAPYSNEMNCVNLLLRGKTNQTKVEQKKFSYVGQENLPRQNLRHLLKIKDSESHA